MGTSYKTPKFFGGNPQKMPSVVDSVFIASAPFFRFKRCTIANRRL